MTLREGGEEERCERIRMRDGVSGYTVDEEIAGKRYPNILMRIRILSCVFGYGLNVAAWILIQRSSSFRGSRSIWFVVGRVWGGEVGNAHVMEVLQFGSSLAESGVEKLAACDVWRREARCAWSDDADVIGEGCTAAGFTRQAVHQGGGWAHMRMLRRTQMWCYWVKYDTTNDLFVMVFDAGVARVVNYKLKH
ncbi:hypothetical protein LR48_Vigan04g205600 [Vigna angularis]|uniref:Uncharacterized protein n=1 Tax=Phaseolus angularis TaxID=3914 RepID=A0A0L9UGH8_PHAAN|nr:hypothetical protein LR48_Vigan04g205600 [Vigna angularis]